MIAQYLMAASAGVLLLLGFIHLRYTFFGPKLAPRDRGLRDSMADASPVLTTETTMWKAWVGFNASHSMGLILFGLIYGSLALVYPLVLFHSWFLLGLGFGFLGGLVLLARAYWFSIPFWGITFSTACYVASLVAAILRPFAA